MIDGKVYKRSSIFCFINSTRIDFLQRDVWEPGEKLTFTWTHVNFDGFYYDAQNKAGNETLTISLENMKDWTIPKDGIEYSTTVAIATARYRQFGKYAVIGFMGEKCLAGYLLGWSNGLNYAGFWYDIDSGNYSESLEITNMTGRMIPPGGLTYTSYRVQVPYTVTSVKGKKPPGTDGSYFMYSLGGKKYAVRNNGLARILVEQGEGVYEKKTVSEMETWELGNGYTLISPYINTFSTRWDAQIILKRNGIELQNIRLLPHNMYAYAGGEDAPIFVTYLEDVFSGTASFNMIQLKYTWLISSNVTDIKEGDVLGVFKVTKVRPK